MQSSIAQTMKTSEIATELQVKSSDSSIGELPHDASIVSDSLELIPKISWDVFAMILDETLDALGSRCLKLEKLFFCLLVAAPPRGGASNPVKQLSWQLGVFKHVRQRVMLPSHPW